MLAVAKPGTYGSRVFQREPGRSRRRDSPCAREPYRQQSHLQRQSAIGQHARSQLTRLKATTLRRVIEWCWNTQGGTSRANAWSAATAAITCTRLHCGPHFAPAVHAGVPPQSCCIICRLTMELRQLSSLPQPGDGYPDHLGQTLRQTLARIRSTMLLPRTTHGRRKRNAGRTRPTRCSKAP